MHPAWTRREWWLPHYQDLGDQRRDADQDYLESDSEAARIRLRHRAARGQIGGLALTVDLAPHRRNRPRCTGCGQAGRVYDRLTPRRFEFVPLWGLRVFFLYAMRRVDCSRCGVRVEQVPWADGKHQLTTTYMWFLATWAKRLSWQEVARVFRTSWDQVFRSVAMAVAWGRDHVDLRGIRAIGIDEIHWQHGAQFLTLVYQIDVTRKRLLWIGQHRRAKTLLQFFRWFGTDRTAALTFICSDMWKPYLQGRGEEGRPRAPHPRPLPHREAHERRDRCRSAAPKCARSANAGDSRS